MVRHIFIYMITNKINGKKYIGQTIRPVEQRFRRHILDAQNGKLDTHFARAIRKHGEENFDIEIIDIAKTQEELNEKEQYWIKYYDSVRNGYNETDAVSKCGGNTYQSKSDDELSVIADKIRESKLGSKNPHARAVKCMNVETLEEFYFDTLNECREFFGEKNHRFISTRVCGELKGLFRNKWKFAYANEMYGEFFPARSRRRVR